MANANSEGNAEGGFLFGHGHVCWLQSIGRSGIEYRGFSPSPIEAGRTTQVQWTEDLLLAVHVAPIEVSLF